MIADGAMKVFDFVVLFVLPNEELREGYLFVRDRACGHVCGLSVAQSTIRAASTAVKRKFEEYRKERFLDAGVLAPQVREDTREELRALEMPTISKLHRRSGTKMPIRMRAGTGAFGTMVAYEELTRMGALTGLQRKVRREMEV